jgi:hypothetical protein
LIKNNVITLTDPDKIRTDIRNFFKTFYSTKGNQLDIRKNLFTIIPSLDDYKQEEYDAPLRLQEVTTALGDTKKSESPGLDKLTYAFYKEFWELLGPLLLKVATTSLQEGQLPSSMRNGFITLITKKRDLTAVSNGRPITLMNTD